jgi:hypothetical protein
MRQKQKRRFDCSIRRFCYSFSKHRSAHKGWRLSHVHVPVAVFLFRRRSAGSHFSGQHPIHLRFTLASLSPVPLGFCLVAFPPPPVTFPATRLTYPKIGERPCTRLADHFQLGVTRFYPSNSVPICQSNGAKPFGFGFERFRRRLSAPSVFRTVCHHIRSTSRCRSKCP